jgi:hypothetical protein
MNQTTIASTYDGVHGHSAAVKRQWLDLVTSCVPFVPKLIVDVFWPCQLRSSRPPA